MDVAIVGVAGRYPLADSVDAFWQHLVSGRNAVREIPEDRWDWRRFAEPDAAGAAHSYSRWGGFLDGIEEFDAGFFNILPREAAYVDPHERLFLESAWSLLEETGYLGTATAVRDTGVFVGLMNNMYGQIGAAGWAREKFLGPRSAYWSVANRVSYYFDFRGPSLAVDTACSSSLTALHLAAESIRRGECAMAIAGGVNLLLHPAHYVSLCAAGMMARDGRCKTFDERADGFVPGEGVGTVLLKPLGRAVDDGDQVWAVIRASHVRAEGRTMGYAVPSPAAQAELIARTLALGAVDPRTIGYVEAHGTGTALGDVIEIQGLSRAYGGLPAGTIPIGSVKSNIGHLEGAAGIAGVTKVLLQLRHGQLTPTINLRTLNPKIGFDASPLWPVREVTDWPRGDSPRRAAVSSFGAGGTDVHLILEEHRAEERTVADGATATDGAATDRATATDVFLLSARTRDELARLARLVADSLATGPLAEAALGSVIYTSQVGRREMRERLAIACRGREELSRALDSFLRGEPTPEVATGTARTATPTTLRPSGLDAGRAWCTGAAVEWAANWPRRRPPRAPFPPYPFSRRRYWPSRDDLGL